MNYITNQSNKIIAADDDLLKLLDIKNIETLSEDVILGNIQFEILSDQNIRIITATKSFSFKVHTSALSSMLGSLTLISLSDREKPSESISAPDTLHSNDDLIFLKENEELFLNKEDLSGKMDISKHKDTSAIIIEIEKVSKDIGISTQDYKLFLNEYIDTTISLEKDIRSTNSEKSSSAITSLVQLSSTLQLPLVNVIMQEIIADLPNKDERIDSLYELLSRLVIKESPIEESPIKNEAVLEKSKEEVSSLMDSDKKDLKAKEQIKSKSEDESFAKITLQDINPIPFTFELSEAANDLSLPVELVEEFVRDFIEQTHIEIDNILVAYEKGDLKTIQKIGHMLKNASSNLCINTLSDTLHEIEFCNDSANLENLIKQYWGQFLALEQKIDYLAK